MICAIPYGGNVSKLLKWTAFVFIGSRKSSAFRVLNVVRMCDKTLFETLPEAQWIQAFEFIAQIIFPAEIDSN